MQGQIITKRVHDWLKKYSRGEVEFPEHLVKQYILNVEKKISKKRPEFRLRLSNLGRPTCQLQSEKLELPKKPRNEYQRMYTFMVGDMSEQWLILVMQAAGIELDYDIPVTLQIGGYIINGTVDVIIDGKVYDIKTMSSKSFQMYTNFGGFKDVAEDDPFGYVEQLFAYSEASGLPPGGWIIINKNTGEIAVTEMPINYEEYKAAALARMLRTIGIITYTIEGISVEKLFGPEDEIFNKKPTGNKILSKTCSWCDFKDQCWPDVINRKSAVSSAKIKPYVDYLEVNYEKE
jgi:hypothetical protein